MNCGVKSAHRTDQDPANKATSTPACGGAEHGAETAAPEPAGSGAGFEGKMVLYKGEARDSSLCPVFPALACVRVCACALI